MKLVIVLYATLTLASCSNEQLSKNQSRENLNRDKIFEYRNIQRDDPSQEYNFKSKREFVNDTMFRDYALLCQSDTVSCAIEFYKAGNNWFIFDGSIWQFFYSETSKSLNKVNLTGINKIIIPKQNSNMNQDFRGTFSFEVVEANGYSSHVSTYFFHPNYGIVGIEGTMVTLIRTDYQRQR